MKKISIMLLAALMLFAFVACEENGDKDAAALVVANVAASTEIGGNTFAAVTVSNNKVTATLAEISTEWADFGTGTDATGYFLPLTITTPASVENATVTAKMGDTTPTAKIFTEGEGSSAKNYVVVKVAEAAETSADALKALDLELTLKVGEDSYKATLDLAEVTLTIAED